MEWDKFWKNVGRAEVAIATGGLSEIGIELGKSASARGELTAIYEAATGGTCGRGTAGGAVNINTCCNYKMYGEFLLDTRRGKVWKYNKTKNVFVRINKQRTKIENATLFSYLSKLQMSLSTEYKALDSAEQRKVKGVFDMNSKVLTKKIAELKKKV